jgi:hypothetical protein
MQKTCQYRYTMYERLAFNPARGKIHNMFEGHTNLLTVENPAPSSSMLSAGLARCTIHGSVYIYNIHN